MRAVRGRSTPDGTLRAAVVVGAIALTAAVHASYQFIVAPHYAYMGLTYASPSPPIYAVMILLIVGLAFLMPVRLTLPSDFLLWLMYVVVVIPSLTISYLARTLPDETQLMLGFVVAACFALAVLTSRGSLAGRLSRIRPLSARTFWILVAAFSAVTYIALAAAGTLTLTLPGLGQVYTVRSAFAETASAHRLLAYLLPSQSAVINPLLIAAGIGRRNGWLVTAGIAGNLLLYGVAGNKSVLFSIPAVLLAAYLFRGGRRPSGALVAWGLAGFVTAGALIDAALRTPLVTGVITRRVIHTPGFLTGAWVQTFLDQPKAQFAYSFLSPFFSYPYSVTPPFVVSQRIFGTPTVNANANLFADGYANFGWIGMLFETLILILILVLANAAGRRMPLASAVMVLVVPGFSLTNGSVLTSLLSHGVFLALLIMFFAPASVWRRVPVPAPGTVAARTPAGRALAGRPGRRAGGVPAGALVAAHRQRAVRSRVPRRPPAPEPSWWQRAKMHDGPEPARR